MYLKKLELFGFKSFAVKTALEFNKGITAIVGPNGSGKSNVADALRWVLGEQSMKNIRTKKGEDLIFAGSPQKPQMGKAQVSLYLDNADGFFPVAFSEIEISRKIFRDGTSEYVLNKNLVRLKEIVEFLAAAHLGVKGFSVVNQGAADAILNASPQEKREIIEEALGLREYQLKKADAQHKLEGTKINLDKARALIAEIEPHLRYLSKQVKKFQKREEIAEELKKTAKDYFSEFFLNLKKERQEAESQRDEAKTIFDRFKKEMEELEARVKEEESRLPNFFQTFTEFEEKLRGVEQSKSREERELGRIEGLMEADREARIKNKESRIKEQKVQLNISEVKESLNQVRQELRHLLSFDSLELIKEKIAAALAIFEKRFAGILELEKKEEEKGPSEEPEANPVLSAKKEEIQKKLATLKEEAEKIQQNIVELRTKERHGKEQFFNLKMLLDKKRREASEPEGKTGFWEIEFEKLQLREADLKQKLAEAELTFEDLNSQSISAAGASKEELEMRMAKLKRELGEIGAIDTEVTKEHQEVSLRHEFLTVQLGDLEKSIGSLNVLIADLEEKIEKEFSSALVNINGEFDKYFKLMFGGGKAEIKPFRIVHKTKEIELPDTEEMTEVEEGIEKERELGLEIKVDLPRKHVRDIHAMSGGERALTSIALLFGIISVSPPPFLILDEIDAHLDESNSQRFGKMLRELGQKTQFIVITHNRETMKQSNVLYGVTMEEGCSKLLSLKFEEKMV